MAREITLNAPNIHLTALDAALKAALPGKVIGLAASLAANGLVTTRNNPTQQFPDGQILLGQFRAILEDSTVPADDAAAQVVADAHDPVFLTCDKTNILANGSDAVTITVRAPKQGAAAVVLQYNVNGGVLQDWPIPLVNGVGSDTLTAIDPGTTVVTLKNPANRSVDVITLRSI